MKNILYTIILLLLSTNLLADATKGEIFGLRLGDLHPVDETDVVYENYYTKVVWISSAIKPVEYGNIYVFVTKKTHTIFKIAALTCFEKGILGEVADILSGDSNRDRRDFEAKQYKILKAKYTGSNVLVDNHSLWNKTDRDNKRYKYIIKIGTEFRYGAGMFSKTNVFSTSDYFDCESVDTSDIYFYANNFPDSLIEKEYRQYLLENTDMEGL